MSDKHRLQEDKWFFNWERMLETASTLEIHGLFAANHRLLALMAVDFSPGVATVEYVERSGHRNERAATYRTLPHMIGYACELHYRVFGDYMLVIAPKTTSKMRALYNDMLDTTLPYLPEQAIENNYTYIWASQWKGDTVRDAIFVQGYCAKAMRDLYYKQEGS